MNRVEFLQFDSNPSYNMRLLLSSLDMPSIVPRPNKYYTFVYKAKTRGIRYDMHPLILCGNVYKWGFTGDNVHIGIRQYTWEEVKSNLYELSEEEFQMLVDVPLARYLTT